MTAHRAVVLADGDPPSRAGLDAAWPGWADDVDLVIAADGGARLAAALDLTIDAWVGDGDSLGPDGLDELRRQGVPIELSEIDKDASDAELGLLAAIRAGATQVTVLGALGGPRLDHALANIQLLAHPAAAGVMVQLLDPLARVRLLAASGDEPGGVRLGLSGRPGEVVSLLPLGDVVGVTTEGLRYPLRDEDLPAGPARGLSNVREGPTASVTLRRGRLLVVEVPATLPG
ncbi:MAG TPA: thiamine diphosphokinase [Candidatus Limnocylindrales bacterium]